MFWKEIGVPYGLVVDPSGEQTSKEVKKFCHQVGTSLRILEESTQWANRTDLYIGLLKKSIRKIFVRRIVQCAFGIIVLISVLVYTMLPLVTCFNSMETLLP